MNVRVNFCGFNVLLFSFPLRFTFLKRPLLYNLAKMFTQIEFGCTHTTILSIFHIKIRWRQLQFGRISWDASSRRSWWQVWWTLPKVQMTAKGENMTQSCEIQLANWSVYLFSPGGLRWHKSLYPNFVSFLSPFCQEITSDWISFSYPNIRER